jgi:dienelactone hydrolase
MKRESNRNAGKWKSILFVFLLASVSLQGQDYKEYPLYPDGIVNNPISHPANELHVDSLVHPNSLSGKNRVYSFVSEPTYLLFPAAASQNKHIGLVIAPGGGLRNVWLDKEGTDLAIWLSQKGISCMVLKYRVNRRDESNNWQIPIATYVSEVEKDAKQAMLAMRSLAAQMDFDSKKVGMVGFSAGGWLIDRITVQKMDKYRTDKPNWMPDFAGLIYHGGAEKSVKNQQLTKNLPPMFMAIARDDNKMDVNEIMPYLTNILLSVEKSELHVYNSGLHGFGLAYENESSVSLWKESFYKWMIEITK